ncbi:MAG: DUF262 domain-containing protein [Hyphomicrobiaceae bacterium]
MSKASTQIDLAEKQIRSVQQDVDYTVREYPIEVVVAKYTKGLDDDTNDIFVPDYQRDLVWEEKRQSKFIESLLIGLPIPYLFVADVGNENDDLAGRLEIVDGTQRIRTLVRFLNDELQLEGLEKLPALNGFKYSDLPPSRQRRFGRITLRLIELTEKANEETRRDMFDRINTGPVKLNDMESRRGSYPGPFVDLVKELARDSRFATLAPISPAAERRYEREELVARFFALRDEYQTFGTTPTGKVVSDFVDDYVKRMNESLRQDTTKAVEKRLRSEWDGMLDFVQKHFLRFSKGPKAKSTPRVRFEAIAVGTALALAAAPNPPGAEKVSDWIQGDAFKSLTTSDAANNRNRVLDRINYVRDKLSGQ